MTHHKQWTSFSVSITVVLVLASVAAPPVQCQDSTSLGEIAREVREKKRPQVQVTAAEGKELFSAVDSILEFAKQDTGFAKRTPVKRQLVGRDQVDHQFAVALGDRKEQLTLRRSEVVLKKFGLLPADFDLKQYLLKNAAEELGGYYDPKDKTMYLLNWVPLEQQRPVMAHELTHALQDQNYDLERFLKATDEPEPQMTLAANDRSEESIVHRAIVEGQAMVVYMDYMGKAMGVRLSGSPDVMKGVVNVLENYDSPVRFHNAPRVLQETGMFPYREGLAFELEVLRKGGRPKAFAGVFARPPQSTYEVLQPEAYLNHAKIALVTLPDLRGILGNSFEAYDSGTIGELDVRIMAREFGRENDIYSVAQQWNGGAYIAVQRRSTVKTDSPKTADLALLYVSRWKTEEAAERFAQIYAHALPMRVKVLQETTAAGDCPADTPCKGPLWASRIMTDEGPTFLEVWPGNTVIIAQSFDEQTMPALRRAVLSSKPTREDPPAPQRELSSSLYTSASFTAFAEKIRLQVAEALATRPSGRRPNR